MNDRTEHLVIIDPQVIFADPQSAWGSPFFAAAWQNIEQLARAYKGRVLFTRWLPTASRDTSWGEYFSQWQFADTPATDPQYALTAQAQQLASELDAPVLDFATFSKWDAPLKERVWQPGAPAPRLLLTGVATDCCVLASALPMADAGAYVRVVTDAVAGSSAENQAAALQVMSLFAPQLTLTTTAQVLG